MATQNSNSNSNSKFKFAACQLTVSENKAENIKHARKVIDEAASNGAKIVALPVPASLAFYFVALLLKFQL
jgi:predicted amidohydrolase